MIRPVKRILVTGATGNVGRQVVAQLSAAGCNVRAMSRSLQIAGLPQGVEAVRGDLSAPDTLDPCLRDVDAVFLVWQLPLAAGAAAVSRAMNHSDEAPRGDAALLEERAEDCTRT